MKKKYLFSPPGLIELPSRMQCWPKREIYSPLIHTGIIAFCIREDDALLQTKKGGIRL